MPCFTLQTTRYAAGDCWSGPSGPSGPSGRGTRSVWRSLAGQSTLRFPSLPFPSSWLDTATGGSSFNYLSHYWDPMIKGDDAPLLPYSLCSMLAPVFTLQYVRHKISCTLYPHPIQKAQQTENLVDRTKNFYVFFSNSTAGAARFHHLQTSLSLHCEVSSPLIESLP